MPAPMQAFFLTKKLSIIRTICYWIAQLGGAVVGSFLVKYVSPAAHTCLQAAQLDDLLGQHPARPAQGALPAPLHSSPASSSLTSIHCCHIPQQQLLISTAPPACWCKRLPHPSPWPRHEAASTPFACCARPSRQAPTPPDQPALRRQT